MCDAHRRAGADDRTQPAYCRGRPLVDRWAQRPVRRRSVPPRWAPAGADLADRGPVLVSWSSLRRPRMKVAAVGDRLVDPASRVPTGTA